MLSRRTFLAATAVALPRLLRAEPARLTTLPSAFARLEQTNGGRLGVAVLDTATGERSGHRTEERFPMCSTFKFLLASAVLQRVDRHQENLDRLAAIPPKPLLGNSPLTEPHAGATMSIADLCHAALTRSDNTAANILLESIGGPAALTSFCRSIGDTLTRLDRNEPTLNESLVGDPRDTTSPFAMVYNLKSILLGTVLSPPSRDRPSRRGQTRPEPGRRGHGPRLRPQRRRRHGRRRPLLEHQQGARQLHQHLRLHGTISVGWKESRYRQGGSRDWVTFGKGYNKVQAFRSQLDNFARSIRGEEMLLITAEDALASVR